MKPKTFMVIAGEASGDLLAAELVRALRSEIAGEPAIYTADYQPLHTSLAPRFFGAGGPQMAAAGVELDFDMTQHAVIGLSAVIHKLPNFVRLSRRLQKLAREREPDAIICVDYGGFNGRFAGAVKRFCRARTGWFHDWQPKLIQYVSPQVWASREGRVHSMAHTFDLVLSIFPFEKEYYAARVPRLQVEFVGHPLLDRFPRSVAAQVESCSRSTPPVVLLLPGSRPGELRRHMPLLAETAKRIVAQCKASFRMVLPRESLREITRPFESEIPQLEVQIGRLDEALRGADVALAKSGTITLECAYFGVPSLVFYKTSLLTYVIARRLAKVKYLAMPNLLADTPVFPEFIQGDANPENLARATLELLDDPARQSKVKARLAEIVAGLGAPGANRRAAKAIINLLASNSELGANPQAG